MEENILLDNEYLARISRNKIHKKIINVVNKDNNNDNTEVKAPKSYINDESTERLFENSEDNDQSINKSFNFKQIKLRIPDCSICREYLTKNLTVITVCGHVFHKECIDSWLSKFDLSNGNSSSSSMNGNRLGYLVNDNTEPTCPLCRIPCSLLTLCDLVNITIDEIFVIDEDYDINNINFKNKENENNQQNNTVLKDCNLLSCKLKLKSISDESITHIKEKDLLKTQLEEIKADLYLNRETIDALEKKNEVLRDDLNRATHELAELNQKYFDINRKYTHLQSNLTISKLLSDSFQDDYQAKEETIQVSNLIGFNPLDDCGLNKKNEDILDALKTLSKAFIKLTERCNQLKEKSSLWKSKCYQLRDSNAVAMNECISLKQKLVSIKKNEKATFCDNKKIILNNLLNKKDDIIVNTQDRFEENDESFTSISKKLQNRKINNTMQSNEFTSFLHSLSSCPSHSRPSKSTSSILISNQLETKELNETNSPNDIQINESHGETNNNKVTSEESPKPKYYNLLNTRRVGHKRKVLKSNSQSISTFFSARKLKFNVIN
ncbi:hypothetical protein FG386_003688 [Cryptosporidium ryanae]|uniref:uncharacterized protein n=1 Tax=Cryptosporidium ryanae TaxID=515981 RepID=UPI00351AA36F|nr:hypothetical protein FG386_003688 [Cryptosporidium ryanae]